MNKVAIIGYGNVGYHLSNRISAKKHEVTIFSRSQTEDFIASPESINPSSFDFIILTVPDQFIKEVANSLTASDAMVIHTSGAVSINELSRHTNTGVIYPMQTFSRFKEVNFARLPIFVEGSNDESEQTLFNFVRSFGTDVRLLNSLQRSKLHLAAVFACNFSNHMFHLSEKLLEELNMTFDDMQPLVVETLEKALELAPSKSQTGPAIRNDKVTIQKHLDMLSDMDMKEIYSLITKDIQRFQ